MNSTLKNGHLTGFGTSGYRHYVLLLLMLVYTLNFVDRTLIAVVAQPIITSFGLTDSQWGLLYGPPFAIFYAVMGLPIALWADRSNRVKIITICIILWSIMTALCGFAAGFLTLLFFRIGVAVGEAGCTPPANSIIGDYFIARKRATALGVYSMGVTLGGVLANVFGGPIAQMHGSDIGAWVSSIGLGGLFSALDWASIEGWRIAFVVVGVPGVVIALIVLMTIKEPPRGYSDLHRSTPQARIHWSEAFQELKGKPSFWWMAVGASLVAFVGYGLVSFQAPFLQREHGLEVRDAAINFGAPLSFLAAIGTFLGGYITEKLTPRWPTAVAWVPAVGLLIAVPAYIGAFYLDDLKLIFLFWGIGAMCHYAYLGAQYNIGQGVVSHRSRATAIATLLILVSLIGNGIGPYFVGFMSDFFMISQLDASGFASELSPALCLAKDSGLDEAQQAICTEANSTGLKQAMAVTVCWFILAAACFMMSARTLKRDFVAELEHS
ncbi:MAG: MFS transporter [Halieaceae bacterium]|jgi:MFS family permease|nr:MFS transporter [Halieaceae bacterium]